MTKRIVTIFIMLATLIGLAGCGSEEVKIRQMSNTGISVKDIETKGKKIKEDSLKLWDSLTNKTSQKDAVNYDVEYHGGYQEIVLNDNQPDFNSEDLSLKTGTWQKFSNLDNLNRVGEANALIGKDSFPKEKREGLSVKPTGWHQKKTKDGKWLYNRCHLIGFQLTGENDNPKNLMTGTRSFNTPHMLNYENQIKSYIEQTGNHVRYRVTPVFKDDELLARGVQLEAKSIESENFYFNVYIYNVQDGYEIDYSTGASKAIK